MQLNLPAISTSTKMEDDGDEILSFCDLPFYTDASADSSLPSFSSSSEEGSLFEFLSSGLPAHQQENVVFCGKLIQSRVQDSSDTVMSRDRREFRQVNQKLTARRGLGVSGSKSRKWFMVIFGSMRLPSEMGLADIKHRQRRPRSKVLAEDEGRSSGNGLIRLIRSLSCRGAHSTSIVPNGIQNTCKINLSL